MTDKNKVKVEHPEARFDRPKEVVRDTSLTLDEKKKALDTWEQDAHQLLTASNEGMPGKEEGLERDDHHQLGEVRRAKEKIGEAPKQKPSH